MSYVTQAVPQIKVAMGYPVRSVVIEQIISLHATWVVFDRYSIITNESFLSWVFSFSSY